MTARFACGDLAIVKSSGDIVAITQVHISEQDVHYSVLAGNKKRRFNEDDLAPYVDHEDSIESAFENNDIKNANQFLLYAYYHKMSENSESSIYSYQGNRILFNPFQYKPLLKFISADSEERLLIADEVGVGKTIESGIILDELLARQELKSTDMILIVCPNILCLKWKQELRDKFGMNDFYIHNGHSLMNMLQEIKDNGKSNTNHSIVGEQLFRNPKYERFLTEIMMQNGGPFINMLIVDECHHYRNTSTETHKLGVTLSRCSERVLMLSATPFNLREDDLFNQLHMLNESQYPDYQLFRQLGKQVRSVNKAISYLRSYTPENRRLLQKELTLLAPIAEQNSNIDEEFQALCDKVQHQSAISAKDVVHYERTLNFLNPLSTSFTRTLKRDALSHRVTRATQTVSVHFTPLEYDIYHDFIDTNITKYRLSGVNPKAFALITNTLERIAASSIPALADNIARYACAEENPADSIEEGEDVENTLREIYKTQYEELRRKLSALNKTDSKFDALMKLIESARNAIPDNPRIMIFSYYVGTLRYLRKRLHQQGFRVGLMYGETPLDTVPNKVDEMGFPVLSRYDLIEAFKNGEIDILLASEVGGEGLDFQFCATLINYDLPYNPMRIEQRIGRIDRMGQKSDKVIIGNLCIIGTVDEVINRVLLSRIADAADLVGDLEPIITSELVEINQLIITKGFSDSEIEKRIHEIELRIEEEKATREDFDEQRYELVNDTGFRDEFENDVEKSRILPEDSLHFTVAYLKETPGCWSKALTPSVLSIHLSNDVKTRLRIYYNQHRLGNAEKELNELANSPEYVRISFDGETAFEDEHTLFLKPCGPWVHFMIDDIRSQSDDLEGQVFHGLVQQGQCDVLHTGIYCVFVYDYGFTGFRKSNLTQYIIVNCQNGEVLIPEETIWKQLLNFIIQTRNALPITYEEYLKFKELADAASDENAQEFKTTMARGNDVKISSRIQALRRLSQTRVENYQKDLQTASAANKERLMKSIERDRKRTADKIDELEKRKLLGVSTAFQSILILEVV